MTTDSALPVPAPRECLVCFLERALPVSGCDGSLRLAAHWRQAQPYPADWLPRWLERRGGFCACEVLMNVFDDDTLTVLGVGLRCPESLAASIAAAELDGREEDEGAW